MCLSLYLKDRSLQADVCSYFSLCATNFHGRITLLTEPRKSEGLDSAAGLNAKDELLMLSKKSSLRLSGPSIIKVELRPLPPKANGNFPVVGDG